MPDDLFIKHGLDALHDWPEAQDQVAEFLRSRETGAARDALADYPVFDTTAEDAMNEAEWAWGSQTLKSVN
ncbi:hypothetical protein Sa4125_30400 [Aureimonas sp. SA4125]|uniref:hypothetical protein n=1 Tax=Aureimonas sp. SA4125 TaxID=2826993 RepID=UPI001CC58095|nr:hypothetical protein [Aureimonas sp. SA4125]BDA85498.1 hypothetical protein Sa4125_30400 [Aureimonas sp. SA4125]